MLWSIVVVGLSECVWVSLHFVDKYGSGDGFIDGFRDGSGDGFGDGFEDGFEDSFGDGSGDGVESLEF